jgi:intracellular septation protein
MKHILEYFPLLAFFISYYIFDVYVATAILIGATCLQLILLKIIFNEIERKNWVVFAVVTLFGALTLYFHNDDFIKLKASIIYSVFAIVLLGYQFIGQSIPQKFMGKDIPAPDHIWRNVSYGWAVTCLLAAIANYWVAFNLSLDTWVNFKVFGLMGLTFVMFIITGIYLYKYMPNDEEEQP